MVNDLECRDVVKTFGPFRAVDDVSVEIPAGSFFSILGPSGCGKTTLLRMIAGFGEPTSGDILIKGRSVLGVPPNRRPVNMVFQHLALFPMMTVAENVAYGLRRRRTPRAEIERRVADVLGRIGLPDAGGKRISQLSGGQKQRIAIARCMVLDPDVLLLDEPLGALDLKLREHMKIELKQLQHQFGTTFVYITHDQSEALVMSDRVAVMNGGRFEQVGTPEELYWRPATAFVAGFVGDANRLVGRTAALAAGAAVVDVDGIGPIRARVAGSGGLSVGDAATVFVRPTAISVSAAGNAGIADGANRLDGTVESVLFNGAASQVLVRLAAGGVVSAALPLAGGVADLSAGAPVRLSFAVADGAAFPGAVAAGGDP